MRRRGRDSADGGFLHTAVTHAVTVSRRVPVHLLCTSLTMSVAVGASLLGRTHAAVHSLMSVRAGTPHTLLIRTCAMT